MSVISHLEPKAVFSYFEEICAIPHGSGNMEQISNYCVDFAKRHGLRCIQDEMKNIIIFKNGTLGYENSPTIILQGHLDMVAEQAPGSAIDMTKDGLQLQINGDYLSAKDTTLGGDDGIAVAYGLALLASSDIPHPPLELLLTVDEEIGLLGAAGVDLSMLKGRKLINLDSEEEGIFLTSCAGGATVTCSLPITFTQASGEVYELSVGGLLGGHSGAEIHKERGNSNALMGRLLYLLQSKTSCGIVTVGGGLKDNAIPRQTVATVCVQPDQAAALEATVKEFDATLRGELRTKDPGVTVTCTAKGSQSVSVMEDGCAAKAVTAMFNLPCGVQAMSADIPGLVETSLNFGILKQTDAELQLCFSVRSSVESSKWALISKLESLTRFLGGEIVIRGSYPGWEYKADSALRETFRKAYLELSGKEPRIEAIHAGLECGLLSGKIEGLDCIALGPDMADIHTTEERLSISSTGRTWELLKKVLEQSK